MKLKKENHKKTIRINHDGENPKLQVHIKCKFYRTKIITHYKASPTSLFEKHEQSTRNLRSEPLHDMNWGFDQLQRKLHYHRQAQTTRTYASKHQSASKTHREKQSRIDRRMKNANRFRRNEPNQENPEAKNERGFEKFTPQSK